MSTSATASAAQAFTPSSQLGWAAAGLSSDPRFQRDALAIHGLGPRAVAEALAGIVVLLDPLERAEALDQIARYRALPPDAVAFAEGDRFPRLVPVDNGDASPAIEGGSWTRLGDAQRPVIDRLRTSLEQGDV